MMMKMNKVTPRQVLIALAIATVVYLMFANNKKSMYSVEETYVCPIRVWRRCRPIRTRNSV